VRFNALKLGGQAVRHIQYSGPRANLVMTDFRMGVPSNHTPSFVSPCIPLLRTCQVVDGKVHYGIQNLFPWEYVVLLLVVLAVGYWVRRTNNSLQDAVAYKPVTSMAMTPLRHDDTGIEEEDDVVEEVGNEDGAGKDGAVCQVSLRLFSTSDTHDNDQN
jgi:hypothetical protein